MSIKCSVFIATSLDGYIARSDGSLDWLPGSDGKGGGEDYGFGAFFASIDTLVMGRKTYELARSFDEWPYQGKNVVVLSSGFVQMPVEIGAGVTGTSASPAQLLQHLAAQGARHVYVDGGRAIQSFLRDNLIHELTITRIPVLIGVGIPLFGPLPHDVALQHMETKAYESGFVQSRYRVVHAA